MRISDELNRFEKGLCRMAELLFLREGKSIFGDGGRIATAVTGFLQGSAVQVRRQGEGTPPYGTVCRGGRPCPPGLDNATPCRAGPVCPAGCGKNLSGRCRHRPLRMGCKRCSGQATMRVAPTVGIIWGHEVFLFSCKFILEKQLGICYTLHYSGNKFLSA